MDGGVGRPESRSPGRRGPSRLPSVKPQGSCRDRAEKEKGGEALPSIAFRQWPAYGSPGWGGEGGKGCAGWHMPEAPGPRAASPTAHGERGCRLSGGPSPGPDVLRAPEEERSCGPAPAGSLAGWPPPWFLRQLWRSAFSGAPLDLPCPGSPPPGRPSTTPHPRHRGKLGERST